MTREQKLVSLEKEKESLSSAQATPVIDDSEAAARTSDLTRVSESQWHRGLMLASCHLASSRGPGDSALLSTLLRTVVLPSVTHTDPLVRARGVECLALCALLDKTQANSHVFLFVQVLLNDQECLQEVALKGLLDLMLLHGAGSLNATAAAFLPSLVEPSSSERTSSVPSSSAPEGAEETKLTSVLATFLNSTSQTLRWIAAEGFARLLYTNSLVDLKVLASLLLLYFNPTTEDDLHLRQCLSVFFPAYAFSSESHQRAVEAVFLPVLTAVLAAPPTSPLCTLDPLNIARFMVFLTDSSQLPRGSRGSAAAAGARESPHDRLASALADELLARPVAVRLRHALHQWQDLAEKSLPPPQRLNWRCRPLPSL